MGAPVAHPTMYRDILFRSRLEAQWASWLDIVRWPWVYEPDLGLDGYIADFLLPFAPAPVLLEVKPAAYRDELWEAARKIDRSGWAGEVVCVGLSPVFAPHLDRPGCFGLMQEAEPGMSWDNAILFHCRDCDRLSLRHEGGSLHCRVTGCDGGRWVEPGDVLQAWNMARHETRWEPGGHR